MINFLVFMQQFRNPVLDFIVEAITITAEETTLLIAICIIYWCINKKMGYVVAFAVVFSSCMNETIKEIFKVQRPWLLDGRIIPIRQETATGYSFPSGHTQKGATFWAALAIYMKNKKITTIAIIMMVLIALSRVYLSVHTPLDVVAGLIFAVGFAFLSYYMIMKLLENKTYWTFIVVSIVLIVLLFFIRDETFYKMAGVTLAFLPGFFIENKYIRFASRSKLWKQALKVIIGIAIALGIRLGLGALFPDKMVFDFIRYFTMGMGILVLAPWIFVKTKLSVQVK
ncbi:MAG: phosphatase PAP2 family protein [Clostridiales bacterium]|nr:phosphatase PAP2 family protein [Clostridiales bacterium]